MIGFDEAKQELDSWIAKGVRTDEKVKDEWYHYTESLKKSDPEKVHVFFAIIICKVKSQQELDSAFKTFR